MKGEQNKRFSEHASVSAHSAVLLVPVLHCVSFARCDKTTKGLLSKHGYLKFSNFTR